ncbi:MAG TPA: HAMP domain-containing sensor histidine kinase [Devosia sp.]|nr:HAMP domain-containing sensor histidine kinase [Devosia sp.]
MRQPSLRLRLLGLSALSVAGALVLAGLAIGALFVANSEASVRASLSASLSRLVALIDPATGGPSAPMADPRYEQPASGIYWQVRNLSTDAIERSRSLWDFTLDAGGAGDDGAEHFLTLEGPAGQSLSALARTVRFEGAPFRVVVAEDRSTLNETVTRFGWQLAIALTVLGLALLGAVWFQLRLGLAPLERIRAGIGAVRHKPEQRLADDYPREVMPLVGEVNALLDAQDAAMQFARSRAADLAHGLKTPLSVLEGVSEKLAQSGDAETAATVSELTAEMSDRIDYQLRLSRLRLRAESHRLSASLNQAVTRSVSVLQKTRAGELLTWDVRSGIECLVDMDAHDLIELVGVLLENAAKWAAETVTIAIVPDKGNAVLSIADDGPGLAEEQMAQLGERGLRLDESRKGSGLGLAIAHEIVALNRGSIAFARAGQRGLQVTVTLPLAA